MAPNMISVLRTVPSATALNAADKTPLFPLFSVNLQVLPFPESMNPFVVHSPASQHTTSVQ
jgi:hypothetical protein